MGNRPKGVGAAPRNFDEFCEQFRIPVEQEELPEGEEPPAPAPVDTVAFNEAELLRHPAILQALCSHGSLLCRKSAATALYPAKERGETSGSFSVLHSAAQVSEARGLASLIPKPPDPEEVD